MKYIRKAVFPVAGLGTRFLPATKASPKEMLPVVDKPLIQYAAEEAVAAGIDTLVFVYGRNKGSIVDHFDKAYELESELFQRGKDQLLDSVRNVLPSHVDCVFIRQAEALGLGHAVLCARSVVGDEPFAVVLADDLIASEQPVLSQMMDVYNYQHASIVGVQPVPDEEVSSYGVISGKQIGDRLWELDGIVEKPALEDAPSRLGVVGRYLLNPRIFSLLETTGRGAGGEIQLTDAIARLQREQRVLAHQYLGMRYDCGSKLGYLKAQLGFALARDEFREDLYAYMAELLKAESFSSTEN